MKLIPTFLKGFTLVELLIVISIIAILSTVGYIQFRSFSSTQILNDSTGQIQSLLRVAQTNATTSLTSNVLGLNRACKNWIVTFNTNKTQASLICQTAEAIPQESEKTLLTLPANLSISSITAGSCDPLLYPANSASVVFSVLYGKVSLIMARGVAGFECESSSDMTDSLKYGSTNITKDIVSCKGGSIDVK